MSPNTDGGKGQKKQIERIDEEEEKEEDGQMSPEDLMKPDKKP